MVRCFKLELLHCYRSFRPLGTSVLRSVGLCDTSKFFSHRSQRGAVGEDVAQCRFMFSIIVRFLWVSLRLVICNIIKKQVLPLSRYELSRRPSRVFLVSYHECWKVSRYQYCPRERTVEQAHHSSSLPFPAVFEART